jgi:site-specific DNA-methyltransferase (adenine-specific)
MQEIDDKSVDMILCDLPYGTTACKWDVIIKFEPLWKEYNRIIKDKSAIVLFGSEPFSSKLRLSNLEMYRYDWKWNKLKPSNFQLMNFQCGRIHEDIIVFSKAKAVYVSNGNIMNYYPQKEKLDKPRNVKKTMYGTKNSTLREGHTIKELGERTYEYKLPKSIIEFSNANIKEKKHPTEKPVILCEYLIKTYTVEGDLVLDNCAGSGTTLLAAKNLNRQFIGIEKEEKYIEIIKNRLK